ARIAIVGMVRVVGLTNDAAIAVADLLLAVARRLVARERRRWGEDVVANAAATRVGRALRISATLAVDRAARAAARAARAGAAAPRAAAGSAAACGASRAGAAARAHRRARRRGSGRRRRRPGAAGGRRDAPAFARAAARRLGVIAASGASKEGRNKNEEGTGRSH